MNGKFQFNGYVFSRSEDCDKAKKEQEAIDYIRANTDLSNAVLVLKIYDRLLSKSTFKTIVGYEFLWELKEILKKDTSIKDDQIKSIPIKAQSLAKTEVKEEKTVVEPIQDDKLLKMYEKEKTSKIRLRVMVVFLFCIIMGMLAVVRFTPYSVFTDYEEKIINQYEKWQEELDAREAELNKRETALD